MNAVKRQIHLDRIAGSGPKFQMVPPVPAKKGMANHGNSTSQIEANRRQSIRDSMDLDSVESGSRVSVASSNQLEEVVGPLSPMETSMNSPLQIVPNKSTPNKNVIKIASGSPSDITPSRDLRRRTQSVGNMLDEEGMRPRKYENVTDKELAKHAQLASTQLSRGPKRPPMPLPRPARPEH